MANSYTQAVVQPLIPKNLVSDSQLEQLLEGGVSFDEIDDCFYFYTHEYMDSESEATLQEIVINSAGQLPVITVQAAWTCDKLRPSEFGGHCILITKDGIEAKNTTDMLLELYTKHFQSATPEEQKVLEGIQFEW